MNRADFIDANLMNDVVVSAAETFSTIAEIEPSHDL